MRVERALYWTQRSLEFAFDCGATAATLIPTRAGNGAMEIVAANGEFASPTLDLLESSSEFGLCMRRGRVFVDLWDMKRNFACAHCFEPRVERLRELNLRQRVTPRITCNQCEACIASV
jgi:hypothetical protein